MKKLTGVFEVNANDTLGTAVVKGAVKGYLQGVLAAGAGLGVLAIGVTVLSKYGVINPEQNEKEEELDLDDLDKEWKGIRNRAQEVLDRNQNIDVTI